MKIKLAILERDQNYLNKIVSVFNNKFADKLEVYSFTNQESALDVIKNSKIDMFLSCDMFTIDAKSLPLRCGFAYLVDSADIESIHGQRTICKFQKVELIYKEILSIYSETTTNVTGAKFDSNSDVKIIAFGSASGGVGSSTIAVSCANAIVLKEKRVLYINFEQFGNTSIYFDSQGQFNFGDVRYAIKSKKSNLALKLESMIKNDVNGINYFESCTSPMDLMEVTPEDVDKLLNELKTIGLFDYIIIDMDYSINDTNIEILKKANNIVFVLDGTEISNIKMEKALGALTILEQANGLSLTNRISIIYNRFSSKTGKVFEKCNLPTLGGAPKYEGASNKQVMEELLKMRFVEKLL